jgi:TRAP-type C4-dicarboxylate transport system permease small subunit
MLPTSSPVLQASQGVVYVILPLSGLYMLCHLAVRFVRLLNGDGGMGGEASRTTADGVRL